MVAVESGAREAGIGQIRGRVKVRACAMELGLSKMLGNNPKDKGQVGSVGAFVEGGRRQGSRRSSQIIQNQGPVEELSSPHRTGHQLTKSLHQR